MKKIRYALFLVTLSTFCTPDYNGFCSVPVADLLGGPINDFFSTKPTEKAYQQLPYAEKTGHFSSPRIAQLLFNQPVIIKEERKAEVKIEVPYLKYANKNSFHWSYWTLKSNIQLLSSKNKKYLPLTGAKNFTLKESCTLKGITYSAGTHFVIAKEYKNTYSVFVYNPKKNTFELVKIKKNLGIHAPVKFKDKQKLFVDICKEWANKKNYFIPYVFGGLSVNTPLKKTNYFTKEVHFTKKKPSIFYERPGNKKVKEGLDCARMILRAAQMSGLPLKAINTTALRKTLQPLKKHEAVENGDILIWKGHVAMISDVKKGLIVEARSYDSDYGQIHEIPYSQQLKDITSTQKLVDAHFAKPRITRLNKDGKKSHFIYDLEILKLSSLQKNNLL